jgi:hypothetical protein
VVRPSDVYLGRGDYGFEVTDGGGEYDPFAYTSNGLLLVEDFARLPLPMEAGTSGQGMAFKSQADRREVEGWLRSYGVPAGGIQGVYGKVRDLLASQFWVREHLRVYEALSRVDAIRHPERWRPSRGFAVDEYGTVVGHPWSTRLGLRRRLGARDTLMRGLRDLVSRLNEPETWPSICVAFQVGSLPLARATRTWRWEDPLTPMAFQLLEAALRLSEGRRPARMCPACGEIFLALDERRELYCNSRHRDRYLQREHRARVRAAPRGL